MTAAPPLETSSPYAERGLTRARWAPLTGIGFVVLFLASVVASSPPSDDASNAKWIADYTGTANKAGHIVTGVCLVLAGLCLMSFIATLWMRVVDASGSQRISPLPVISAGVAAACMTVGGVLMGGATSGVHSSFAPDADLLRFCNDVGFAMVSIGGMLAAALSVASVSVQARAAGLFGRRLTVFSVVVAVILLASVAFLPIALLLAWLLVVSITLLRTPRVN